VVDGSGGGSEAVWDRVVWLGGRVGPRHVGQVGGSAVVQFLGEERPEVVGEGLFVGGAGLEGSAARQPRQGDQAEEWSPPQQAPRVRHHGTGSTEGWGTTVGKEPGPAMLECAAPAASASSVFRRPVSPAFPLAVGA